MKSQMRISVKQIRTNMTKKDAKEKSCMASQNFLESELYFSSENLMLYMPLGNETDTSLIIENALSDGKCVAIPVSDTENTDIIPCCIDRETVFETGAFSISEPLTKTEMSVNSIDTIVVPGIAFDATGGRIGFGKGFYDRFLKKTDALKIGFCYDFQILDHIPTDIHDISMDYIITESRIIKCRKDNQPEKENV